MSVPTCTFIKEATGTECQAVALKGTKFCHHHQAERRRREYLKRLRKKGGEPATMEAFDLPPLDTVEDVQISLSALFQAVANRRIIFEDSHLLLAILRVASRNLRVKQGFTKTAPPAADPEAWRNKPESEMTLEEIRIIARETFGLDAPDEDVSAAPQIERKV